MTFEISEVLKARLQAADKPFLSTDNISHVFQDGDMELLLEEVEGKMLTLLKSLVIDVDNDHNTKDTARRVAKMYVKEIFSGRYRKQPEVTDFPNAKKLDELYVVGPINVRSCCSHHFAPILGKVWIGIQPSERVMGLSKFHRLANWVMERPQIQEEATISLADLIETLIAPKGLGIVFTAQHLCCSMRGVKDDGTWMTTSVVRGTLRESPSLKEEFFNLVKLHN